MQDISDSGWAAILKRASGEASPQYQAPAPQAAGGVDMMDQAIERARGNLRLQEKLTFGDAFSETFKEGGWKEKIPYLGAAATADKYAELWQASKRMEEGRQTRDDEELVLAFLSETQREQGIGYMVGSILTELPAFVVEFATSGGIVTGGKVALRKALGKGIKEATEKAVKKGAGRRLAGALANTGAQLTVMTGLGELAGGSRVTGNAWRRALPEMRLSEDDAGRMAITFESTAGDFWEQVPTAIADEFIELLSERSGATLMAGAKKIPGIGYIAAMQGDVAKWWAKKYPGRVGELLKTVAEKGGWHGPISEFLEERFGGALRGATGVEEGGILANAFPSLEQQAAELIAFSVPGAIGAAATAATSEGAPVEIDKEGFEKAAQPTRVLTDADRERIVSEFAAQAGEDVEAADVAEDDAGALASKRGMDVVYVQSKDGEPLKMSGALPREGVAVVDVNAEADQAELLAHELAHNLKKTNPRVWSQLKSRLSEEDAASLKSFTEDYARDYETARGKPLTEGLKEEEGLSRYAEERAGLLWLASTPEGRQSLADTIGDRRSAAQALRDWLAAGLGHLGVKVRTTQERRLAELDRLLQTKGTRAEHLRGALLLAEGIDTLVGLTVPSKRVALLAEGSPFKQLTEGKPLEIRQREGAFGVQKLKEKAAEGPAQIAEGEVDEFLPAGEAPTKTPTKFEAPSKQELRGKAEPERGREPATPDVAPATKKVAPPKEEPPLAVPRRGDPHKMVGFDVGPERSFWGIPVDKWVRYIQDKDIRVKRFEEAIIAAKGKVGPETSLYGALERFPGRVEKALRRWRQQRLEPLLKVLADGKITPAEFDEYVYALHAEERDDYIISQGPEKWAGAKVPPSGMTPKERGSILSKVHRDKRADAFRKAAKLLHALNANTRRTMKASGLISQETFDKWEGQYERYVPLRTSYEDDTPGTGGGMSISGPEARKAGGRGDLAHSPMGYSLLQAQRALVRGYKNEVGNTFLKLVEANEELLSGFKVREETEEHDEELGEMLPKEPFPKPYEFTTKVQGKHVYIEIKDPLLRRSLQNLGQQDMGPIVRTLASFNRYLSYMNTSLDPGFILTNFARDLQTAGINLAGEQSGKMALKVIGGAFSGKPQAAVWRGLGGKRDSSDPWLSMFHRMEDAGGTVGWFHMLDFKGQMKKVEKEVKTLNGSPLGQARKIVLRARDMLETANAAFESGTRLSAFKAAVEAGMTDKQAASLSKNLTVNFNRRGEWGAVANSLYLFYNASIQGSFRVFKALGNRKIQGMMVGVVVASALLDMVNRANGGDDDDGVANYDKIPEWIKARNLIIMDPDGSGDHIKIPLPYGFNIFHAMGQQFGAVRAGAVEPSDALVNLASTAWESFYPLGSEASLAQTLLPTIADPLVQIGENRNFAGAPLRPSQFGSPDIPESQLYWSTVNPHLKSVTAWLNEVTGGDKIEPGAIDISPEDLEHVIEFLSGGPGRQASRVNRGIENWLAGEEVPIRDIPIYRRFRGEKDTRYDREKYIERRGEVKRAENQIKEYAGEAAKVLEIRKAKAPLLRLVRVLKLTEGRLRKVRKQKRLAEEAGKAELVKKLDEQAERLQSAFNKRYLEAMK